MEAKCIFRGEIVKNEKVEVKNEVIPDEKVSCFEEKVDELDVKEKEEIKEKKIASIEIIDENS